MAQLQHWSVTCTTCDSPAEYHCNTCGDILCPRCREIHQRSRGTGHHSVVPYSDRVEPGKLSENCSEHPGNTCTLWCQRCDKAACNECVTSHDHKGHEFVKMSSKLEGQRNAMREEFGNYSKLLQQWEGCLQQIQIKTKTYEMDIDKLAKGITLAADRICHQVRSSEATLKKQLQQMRNTQTNLLHDHEKILLRQLTDIKQHMKDVEDKLRSDDAGVLLRYKAKEDKDKDEEPPSPPSPMIPTFTTGKMNAQVLSVMIGSLTMKTEDTCSEKKRKEAARPKSSITGASPSNQDSSFTRFGTYDFSPSMKSLLPTATVMTTIQTDQNWSPDLACTGSGQVWVRTGEDRVNLIDRQGAVTDTITIVFPLIGGMATSPLGELLISDYNDGSIKSVSGHRDIQTLLTTTWKPSGLCCLHNGDVLVAFSDDDRVIQFSTTGTVVRELDKSFFTNPKSVAQNKINKQLYVCNRFGKYANDPGKVLAFDMGKGKLEYEYTGPDASIFTPLDVCTDLAGHVIITDWGNDSIHILDQDGRFLQYMLTKDQGLYRPCTIDTDNDGYAWVSEYNAIETMSRVKLMKYMG